MKPAHPPWRLLIQGPLPPPLALAVDEAIALCCTQGGGRSTLRFYQWDRPAVSLGRFQAAERAMRDMDRPGAPALVRRITGGRAVWHEHELTYSLVSPLPSNHFPSTLHGTVAAISAGLAGGLTALGLAPSIRTPPSATPNRRARNGAADESSHFCFAAAAWYEIVCGGKKIVGSAQRRWRDRFLQQGSILLDYDPDAACRWLKIDAVAAGAAAGLKAMLGGSIGPDRLARRLAQGLADAWGIEWREEPLTEEELELAQRLVREKYGAAAWTFGADAPSIRSRSRALA